MAAADAERAPLVSTLPLAAVNSYANTSRLSGAGTTGSQATTGSQVCGQVPAGSGGPLACDAARRGGTAACFFVLGMSCCAAFECVALSVAFLRSRLGEQVLASLGLCQWLSALCAMIIIIGQGREISRQGYVWGIRVALAYLVLFSATLAWMAARGSAPGAVALYSSVVGCGLATGTLQCLAASLAGLFGQVSTARGVSAALLRGMSGGIVGPCVLQLVLLCTVAPAPHLSAASALGVAAGVVAAALAAFEHLAGASFDEVFDLPEHDWRRQASPGRMTRPRYPTVGKMIHTNPEGLRKKLSDTGFLCALQGCNAFAGVFPAVLLPYLRVGRSGSFVATYAATALIAVGAVADFSGRLLAPVQRAESAPQAAAAPATLLRAGVAAAASWAILHCGGEGAPSALWAGGAYVGGCLLGGLLAVGITARTQRICGLSWELPCPIAGQYTMLAMQSGFIAAAAAAKAV